jgi:hypothetical protein
LLSVNTGIIVGHLYSDVARIFSLEVQLMPQVILTAAGDDDIVQIDPSFTDEISLLVVIEDGALHPVVVGGVVCNESEFLIPTSCQPGLNSHAGGSDSLPSRSLASSSICVGFLGLLSQSHSTIGVLLAHRLAVWQILCSIDDSDQSPNFRAILALCSIYPRSVRS